MLVKCIRYVQPYKANRKISESLTQTWKTNGYAMCFHTGRNISHNTIAHLSIQWKSLEGSFYLWDFVRHEGANVTHAHVYLQWTSTRYHFLILNTGIVIEEAEYNHIPVPTMEVHSKSLSLPETSTTEGALNDTHTCMYNESPYNVIFTS